MKVRAAVLREIGLPLSYAQSLPITIEEVSLSEPEAGEILVEIHAAGLCHSDLAAINGDRPWPIPIVIGHEATLSCDGWADGNEWRG
jgi:alcohol dehydrogenase